MATDSAIQRYHQDKHTKARYHSSSPPSSTRMATSPATLAPSFLHTSKPLLSRIQLGWPRGRIRATTETASAGSAQETSVSAEPAAIDFAFVSSRLLPDGTPDIQIRSTCGGRKLRDIMIDTNIDLYGPYDGPLLNCAGGGTCGTCIVEVVEGKELLSPRTDKEKEKLKRKPKTWRLACQTTVGEQDSHGQVVIQQLPEWKAHEWE